MILCKPMILRRRYNRTIDIPSLLISFSRKYELLESQISRSLRYFLYARITTRAGEHTD